MYKFKRPLTQRVAMLLLLTGCYSVIQAQENSPYSRFGLGDKTPASNIPNRGMGGISAAYTDFFSINYANPASYGFFQTFQERNSKKMMSGRAIFDVGIDYTGRTLVNNSNKDKFTANNVLFSHVMIGVPLKPNWGLAFGLRPMTSIKYNQFAYNSLKDPTTGNTIDSAITRYEGNGGLNIASVGTGYKIDLGKSNAISFGANAGYVFGKRNNTTKVNLYNDTTAAYSGVMYERESIINGLYFDAGAQYHFKLNDKIYGSAGINGNWTQKLKSSNSYMAGTYLQNETGTYGVDTAVYNKNYTDIMYPSSYTAGFILQKPQMKANETGWLVGVDFTTNQWDQYRNNGKPDTAVSNNWQVKVGAELRPIRKRGYASQVIYRVGVNTGPDYIKINDKALPTLGITAGLGLPLNNYNQAARGQQTIINLAFEYNKRGNNDNIVKENMYRISVGFSLTDIWFHKRRYE